MKEIILDFAKFEEKKDVFAEIGAGIALPEYFGGNLDALYDVLTEVDEDVKFYVFPAGKAFEEGFLQVLEDSAEENGHIGVTITKLPG